MKSKWLLGLALASMSVAWAAGTALPGTVNYVEGQVSLNGRKVSSVQNGSATLGANQVLSVDSGKAEILLTPGTFVRVGDGSAVRMVSATLSNPQLEVVRGQAMIEVDYKPKMARLEVLEQ